MNVKIILFSELWIQRTVPWLLLSSGYLCERLVSTILHPLQRFLLNRTSPYVVCYYPPIRNSGNDLKELTFTYTHPQHTMNIPGILYWVWSRYAD